jgi:hypothetical protein
MGSWVNPKYEARNPKQIQMTEIQIRRRRTRFKTKKARIGPPDGVVDKSTFYPKTKNSPPFLDTDSHRINTAKYICHRGHRDFGRDVSSTMPMLPLRGAPSLRLVHRAVELPRLIRCPASFCIS